MVAFFDKASDGSGPLPVSTAARWCLYVLGALVTLAGTGLAVGGAYLLVLHGSGYFLLMGLALVTTGVLIVRLRPAGAHLYATALLLTVLWAVWDVGLSFWPLFSRLFTFGAAGFVISLVYPLLVRAGGGRPRYAVSYGVSAALAICLASSFAAGFSEHGVIRNGGTLAATPITPGTEQRDWAAWGNTPAGTRFAALDQINKGNVGKLKLAWTFRTGSIPESTGSGAEDQNTPLQIGNTVYVCTAYGQVFALDADTGQRRWMFDPKGKAPNWQRCRGLGYFDDSSTVRAPTVQQGTAICRRRLFLPTIDARLIAIDADSGKACPDFGRGGVVDLGVGMGPIPAGYYQQTSTPLVAGDLAVVGGRVADNNSIGEPPGVVRAFDVRTGALRWAWDPGNPKLTHEPPPGQTYTRGTPNVWSAMAYDPALGLIYLPTGNATPDFWAGERTPLDERYSSSVVAVEASTGRVRWTFQTVHHDLWDFDVPAQPALYDLPDGRGGTTPALLQVTKRGEIFMLNRATGRPISPVVERPVPKGNVPGERYAPTQPFSVGMPSIGNALLGESDMWGATPFDQLICRIEFRKMRVQGEFTPPGLDQALQMPGSLGGMNWGSVAIDPTTGYMFVNDMRLGLRNWMVPRDKIPAKANGIEMGIVPQAGTPFGAMRIRFLSPLGIPCQKPPFGTMSAIDVKTRKLVWQVPVGTVQDTGPFNIPLHLKMPVGMPTLGPALATQSGLLFFGGTQDFYLRAFDTQDGRILWKARLPVGSQGGPITYRSPRTGKQYVVITAGGARQSPKRGDYVLAYALP